MNTAELASRLLRSFEGIKLTSYRDSGGVWTIGAGHTGPDVTPGMTINIDQALAMFKNDAAALIDLVSDKSVIEAAALVSFGFNCGAGALRRVLAGNIVVTEDGFFTSDNPPKEYGSHDKLGNILPGLQARRKLEAALIVASKGDSA